MKQHVKRVQLWIPPPTPTHGYTCLLLKAPCTGARWAAAGQGHRGLAILVFEPDSTRKTTASIMGGWLASAEAWEPDTFLEATNRNHLLYIRCSSWAYGRACLCEREVACEEDRSPGGAGRAGRAWVRQKEVWRLREGVSPATGSWRLEPEASRALRPRKTKALKRLTVGKPQAEGGFLVRGKVQRMRRKKAKSLERNNGQVTCPPLGVRRPETASASHQALTKPRPFLSQAGPQFPRHQAT